MPNEARNDSGRAVGGFRDVRDPSTSRPICRAVSQRGLAIDEETIDKESMIGTPGAAK